ncbi:MAG: toprim domain-containing protein [Bacteroidales bacterium]|jgi:hypothetical protein|nr:toprim domain-containing protein [Bacteroidales bacterium]
MNCEQANKISIIEFLEKQGHKSLRETGKYTFFYSPFRSETKPSFVVTNKNRWRDYASKEGGTLVDLVMELNKCNQSDALKYIANTNCSFSFKEQNCIEGSVMSIKTFRPIVKHKALLDYIDYRQLKPFEKVKNEINEIWYTANSKIYFGLAFKNDKGGYEINSATRYKRCLGPKWITTKLKGANNILIFEAFIDYLSFKVLGWNTDNEDYLILNSVSNIDIALPVLKKYEEVTAYLDNDPPGKNCLEKIRNEIPRVIDRSSTYSLFKDLNEYLMNKYRLVR